MRIAACLLILVAGCVQVAVPPSDAESGSSNRSSLSPGLYFGTDVCEGTIRANGETVSRTSEHEATLVISEAGIPVRNGEEEYEGRTDHTVNSGYEGVGTIVEVSAFPNGVRVRDLFRITTDGAEGNMSSTFVYRPLSNGQIELTLNFSLLVWESANPERQVSSRTTCIGIYSR